MNDTEAADVPWGRPVVPGIPLPPFRTGEDHSRYMRALQLYVTLLDAGPPAPTTIALLDVLEQATPGWSSDAAARADLSVAALRVSLSTYFPAPWTPEALARALGPLDRFAPTARDGVWSWGGDPFYSATPTLSGWTVGRSERGVTTDATVAAGDLVLLWMSMYRDSTPFPLAHSATPELAASLRSAVLATRRAHAADAAMPYLRTWRGRRDAALALDPDDAPGGDPSDAGIA